MQGWVTAILAGLVLWFGVGVMRASAGLPLLTSYIEAPSSGRLGDTADVRVHLEAWGRAFPRAARGNDLSAVEGFNAGAELEAVRGSPIAGMLTRGQR